MGWWLVCVHVCCVVWCVGVIMHHKHATWWCFTTTTTSRQTSVDGCSHQRQPQTKQPTQQWQSMEQQAWAHHQCTAGSSTTTPHHTQTTTKCISNHCFQPFNHHNPCQCHHTSKANTLRWSHLVEGLQCGQHVWVAWHNHTHAHDGHGGTHTPGRPWMGVTNIDTHTHVVHHLVPNAHTHTCHTPHQLFDHHNTKCQHALATTTTHKVV